MTHSSARATVALMTLTLALAACGGGGSAGDTTTPSPLGATNDNTRAAAGTTSLAAGASAQPAAASSDTQTYTIHAVAGTETGLVKLAFINDQLALAGRGNVWIDYGGNPVGQSGGAQGLLYYCSGLLNLTDCSVYGTVTYDNPGTYTYKVSYDPSGLLADRVTLTGSIVVEPAGDFVVVSIGDSVASGEGDPQLERDSILSFGLWNDLASDYEIPDVSGCHRSSYAGPAAAVKKLKSTNDITFVHIACSGAQFGNEETGDRAKPGYPLGVMDKINLQLEWVRERFGRIDVVILSGGANNVYGGFSKVVEKCVLASPTAPCSEDRQFEQNLACSIDGQGNPQGFDCDAGSGLAGKYDALQELLQTHGTEDQRPSVVAITEYFDPTHDANGDFPSKTTSVSCGLDAIDPSEWRFLYEHMVVPLNDQVSAAATRNGWVHVGGIAEGFKKHGYCASVGLGDIVGKSWVVKAPESFLRQGDKAGIAHPDLDGQAFYEGRIYDELVAANPPRTHATATTAGHPYVFGTWVNTDVEVTLNARNPIREAGVRDTNYATDEPLCTPDTVATGACTAYSGPFMVTASGRNTVSFYSTNAAGAPETKAKPVEVLIDREPPVMTCSASPSELWPPNKREQSIEVSVTAIDEVSGPADFWLSAVADSYGEADSAIKGFVLGEPDLDGTMLVDRSGNAGARVYTLTYESADAVGNVGSCDVVVTVPHDQRP